MAAVQAALKLVALVVFLGAIAGATYGVQVVLGDGTLSQSVNAEPVRGTLNATGGHAVTYAVLVHNRGDADLDVRVGVSGLGATGESDVRTAPANGATVLFVPLQVPQDASQGEHALDLVIRDGEGNVLREREGLLKLRVLGEAPGFAEGDSASVIYTGRLSATGRVFNTNDNALLDKPFPQTDNYRASPGLLGVTTVPRVSVVAGFYEGMLGMQPGESRTISFPPEKGYGNATIEEREERDERIDRAFELELETEAVARDVFDGYVAETGQGEGAGFEAGEVFVFTQGANRWPYRIEAINETTVTYTLAVQVGERYTLYPFWENGSEVASVNETHATFVTTPTTGEGETFTARSHWEGMTEVKEVTETEIVMRHSPPVGHQYEVSQGSFQPPRRYTVTEVTEEEIVVVTPSTNPLAGQDLTFDVLLVELTK